MAFEYEADVSVRVGVHVVFSSETELSYDDREAFAEGVAGDVVNEDRLSGMHPGGIDDAGCDRMGEEHEITLVSLSPNVLAVESV